MFIKLRIFYNLFYETVGAKVKEGFWFNVMPFYDYFEVIGFGPVTMTGFNSELDCEFEAGLWEPYF